MRIINSNEVSFTDMVDEFAKGNITREALKLQLVERGIDAPYAERAIDMYLSVRSDFIAEFGEAAWYEEIIGQDEES